MAKGFAEELPMAAKQPQGYVACLLQEAPHQAIVTSMDLEVCSALYAAFLGGCAGPRLELKVDRGQGQQDPSESCTSLKAGSPC